MVNLPIEEIIAGNEIFARYMNLERKEIPQLNTTIYGGMVSKENLLYHEDLNWLNAVIEKIENSPYNKHTNATPHTCLMRHTFSNPKIYSFEIDTRIYTATGKSFHNQSESKIEVLWITALQFVKWQMNLD